jgi:protein-S-isoprenylcysteine O-methyltransferase Ste14
MSTMPAEDARPAVSLASRSLVLGYGAVCYLIFFVVFLYDIGFVGNILVPKSIDSGDPVAPAEALGVDFLLLGLFAMQHSVMARPWFKRWWTRIVPPPVERSTFVLATSLALVLLFWQWRPLPGIVWEIEQPAAAAALGSLFAVGWLVVLASTFLIDHFDLFGLRQVYLYAARKTYSPPGFRKPALYRFVRHPIMLGFIIAFWATPVMSWGHLLFAFLTTVYIFIGIQFEERDLRAALGSIYGEYRGQVSMILPWISRGSKT